MARSRVRITPAGWAYMKLKVSQSIQQITDGALRDARTMAPVDTGEMVGTLRAEYPEWNVGRVYVGSDHWFYVEYGTRFMSAQPFMRPAFYRVKARLVNLP